jgi:hypothetical protein
MRVDLPRWTGRQAGIDGRVDWSNACDACRSQQLRRRCRRIHSGTSHAPILGRCIAVEPAPAEIADLTVSPRTLRRRTGGVHTSHCPQTTICAGSVRPHLKLRVGCFAHMGICFEHQGTHPRDMVRVLRRRHQMMRRPKFPPTRRRLG